MEMNAQQRKTDIVSGHNVAREPIYLPLTHIALPSFLTAMLRAADDKMQELRRHALTVTPAWLVNLNSNINGILHVAAEFAMFKASGVKFFKPQEGREINYLADPMRNLYRAITGADKQKALQNHWSSRSTMGGFAAWTLSAIIPDRINSQEEVDKAQELAAQSPVKYAATRLFEAIQIGNPNTKRQQIGLGVTIAGIFSTIAGFGNVNVKTGARFFNWSHTAGGAITALAGSQLLFSLSDKQGWQHFGNTINFRIPLLLLSINKKRLNNDRWGAYALGQGFFQGAAIYSYLYGGAEKLPDGTIVEASAKHGGVHRPTVQSSDMHSKDAQADSKAALLPIETKQAPATKLAKVESREAAMPERVAAHKELM